MNSKTTYMNAFTFSMNRMTCVLDSKSIAPNIEESNFGAIYDEKKTVDESFIFMPVEVAMELALAIVHTVGTQEKKSGFKVKLDSEKQALWDAFAKITANEIKS